MLRPVYMDHHATTPVAPEVMQAMTPYFTEAFGNPSSTTHLFGRHAAEAVAQARRTVAQLLGARANDVIFTGSATESNNLALRGVVDAAPAGGGAAHLVTSVIEHKSVLDTADDLERRGVAVTRLAVDRDGRVDPEALRQAIRPETCLVSIQFANSEIGTLQDVESLARVSAEAGVPFHSDAVQAVGRLPVDVTAQGIQLLSLSGHKLYGPKGIGALICHRRVRLREQISGGGQERGRRSGTLNVPAVIGLAAALELACGKREAEAVRLGALRDRLWNGIHATIPDVVRNGHREERLPNNLNVSFRYVEGEALLMAVKGFALSSGSACTSEQSGGSYVIQALGGPEEDAHSSIRFGLGAENTEEHVDALLEELRIAVVRLRAISPVEPRQAVAARSGRE